MVDGQGDIATGAAGGSPSAAATSRLQQGDRRPAAQPAPLGHQGTAGDAGPNHGDRAQLSPRHPLRLHRLHRLFHPCHPCQPWIWPGPGRSCWEPHSRRPRALGSGKSVRSRQRQRSGRRWPGTGQWTVGPWRQGGAIDPLLATALLAAGARRPKPVRFGTNPLKQATSPMALHSSNSSRRPCMGLALHGGLGVIKMPSAASAARWISKPNLGHQPPLGRNLLLNQLPADHQPVHRLPVPSILRLPPARPPCASNSSVSSARSSC